MLPKMATEDDFLAELLFDDDDDVEGEAPMATLATDQTPLPLPAAGLAQPPPHSAPPAHPHTLAGDSAVLALAASHPHDVFRLALFVRRTLGLQPGQTTSLRQMLSTPHLAGQVGAFS